MGRDTIFTSEELQEIIAYTTQSHIGMEHKREVLLANMHAFRSQAKTFEVGSPQDQLRLDLSSMNTYRPGNQDEELLLEEWFNTAAGLFTAQPEVHSTLKRYAHNARIKYQTLNCERGSTNKKASGLKGVRQSRIEQILNRFLPIFKPKPIDLSSYSLAPYGESTPHKTLTSLLNRQENYEQIETHLCKLRDRKALNKPTLFIIPCSERDYYLQFFTRLVHIELPELVTELGFPQIHIEPINYSLWPQDGDVVAKILNEVLDKLPISYRSRPLPKKKDLIPLMESSLSFALGCCIRADKWNERVFNKWFDFVCNEWPMPGRNSFITIFMFLEIQNANYAEEQYKEICSRIKNSNDLSSNICMIKPLDNVIPGHIDDWLAMIEKRCKERILNHKELFNAKKRLFPEGIKKRSMEDLFEDAMTISIAATHTDIRVTE